MFLDRLPAQEVYKWLLHKLCEAHLPVRAMSEHYPQSRDERLIANGRALLAVSTLLVLRLDRFQPPRHPGFIGVALTAYVVYAFGVALVVGGAPAAPARLPLVTHAVDLSAFPVLMYCYGTGPLNPFSILLVFALLSAARRWQWRGVLATMGGILLVFLATAAGAARVLPSADLDLRSFLGRGVFLAVMAVLLGWLGAHEERRRREMSLLAAWTRPLPLEASQLVGEVLEHAAGVLRAPRVAMVWEQREEPWVYVASWSSGQCRYAREPPGKWDPLVARHLADRDFLCLDAADPDGLVHHTPPHGLEVWQGAPLHPEFQRELTVGPVLSTVLIGETVQGRLFWLDKPAMSSDDVALAGTVAAQAVLRMDYFYLLQRRSETAALEERVRLARDLHDGLLQSLTAAALQLQAIHDLLEHEPVAARKRLQEIQRVIAADQGELRDFISHLKPLAERGPGLGLASRLDELVRRVERGWGLSVKVKIAAEEERIAVGLAYHSFLMVHEALVNAARHGRASAADLDVKTQDGQLRIVVSDNGQGFSFRGRYDHVALNRLKRGPVSLKERIASLGGSLAIDSTEFGARLEITVPLAPSQG
jgi:signal transduction histidine kinase